MQDIMHTKLASIFNFFLTSAITSKRRLFMFIDGVRAIKLIYKAKIYMTLYLLVKSSPLRKKTSGVKQNDPLHDQCHFL